MDGRKERRALGRQLPTIASLWFALAFVFGASPSATSAEVKDCVPSCRDGYACVSGKCVSACNPPCPKGERCTSEAGCVPAAKSASQGAATASGAYVAPSDKALVVFVRGKGARQDHINVFDEQRRFVTVIEHVHRHVKVLVEPGEHTFYFGEIVRADLAAGRTYIIQVSAKSGVWGWTLLVDPALRKSGSFAASPQWIRDTKLDWPNVEKRAAQWDKKVNAKRMNKSIASSEAAWASATDEWRTARTIKKTDGRTAAEARDL